MGERRRAARARTRVEAEGRARRSARPRAAAGLSSEALRGERVHVFEMGPRDGLQNEPRAVPTEHKLEFVRDLLAAGVTDLELGAFVRADRVPQMADTEALYAAVREGRLALGRARAWALVPNRKGLERALKAGVRHIAVFTAATDGFAERNINMSVKESLREYAALVREAHEAGVLTRGYVSTAFGCPFEGKVAPAKALRVIDALFGLGVFQVSIGDTIGVATPRGVEQVVGPALAALGVDATAVHFHDTRGTALANTLRALDLGVRTVDASAGGLGGCPFAPGATGNLATEDLIYLLDGVGARTGIDLGKLCRASLNLARRMERPLSSRFLQAFAADCAS
jgi:hydroxymethylglutaryl-CoA lyase